MMMGLLYMLKFRNGKRYVGITSKSAHRRLVLHLHHARKGRAGALQAAIRKYGEDSFEMRILVVPNDWAWLCDLEQRAIAAYGTRSPHGYNLTDGGEGLAGVKRNPESIAKMAATLKRIGHRPPYSEGWKHTVEARAKIADAGRGRVFTQERRAKIGATKIGNTYNVGRPCKPETILKISLAQKGRKMPEKRRLKMVGRKLLPEQILAMSLRAKGKPWTPARRAAQEAKKYNGPINALA